MQTKQDIIQPLSKPAVDLFDDAFQTQERIAMIQKELELLEGHLANVKSELLKHEIREAGNYELFPKTRESRVVNVEKFRTIYPDIYEEIKKNEIQQAQLNAGKRVNVGDVEYHLGKEQTDKICDLSVKVTYVVLKKYLD